MRDGGSRPSSVVHFGVFEADLEAGELRKRGSRVRLQDRPFRILAMLLEHPGLIVTRQALRERLWGTDTFVDFEHGLNAAMNKLRDALGDSASSPRFIETVPRRGYRFLSPALTVGVAPPLGAPRRRMAILPFRNSDGDAAQEPFCDGLTQEMIVRLGRMCRDRFGIIATPSIWRYRNGDRSPEKVGRELDVDYVLDGTARRSGGRVRIGAQLVHVHDRTILWADSYDRSADDEFAIQREVATHVAESLALELEPPAPFPAPAARPSESRELYLLGKHWLARRTPDGFRKALEYFRAASAADPRCALPLAAIGETLFLGVEYGTFLPDPALAEAQESVLRGLEVDPTVSDGHLILGYIKHRWDWDWAGAETEYLHARQLNPSCADTLHQYAEYLSDVLRHEEALAAIRHARRMSPYELILGAEECCVLVKAGRALEAVAVVDRVIEAEPGFAVAHNSRSRALMALGRHDEAVRSARRAVELGPGMPTFTATLAAASARAGRSDEACGLLETLSSGRAGDYVSPVQFARVWAAMGEPDRAVARLEEGFQARESWMAGLRSDPEWRSLDGHKGFRSIVARIGFPTPAL